MMEGGETMDDLAVQHMAIGTGIYAGLRDTVDIHIHGNPDFCQRLLGLGPTD